MNILKNSDLMIKAMVSMDRELVLKRYAAVRTETYILSGVTGVYLTDAVKQAVIDLDLSTQDNPQLLADEVQYDMELLARAYMKLYAEEYKVYTDRYQAYNWYALPFADWCRAKKGHEALTVSPKYL